MNCALFRSCRVFRKITSAESSILEVRWEIVGSSDTVLSWLVPVSKLTVNEGTTFSGFERVRTHQSSFARTIFVFFFYIKNESNIKWCDQRRIMWKNLYINGDKRVSDKFESRAKYAIKYHYFVAICRCSFQLSKDLHKQFVLLH